MTMKEIMGTVRSVEKVTYAAFESVKVCQKGAKKRKGSVLCVVVIVIQCFRRVTRELGSCKVLKVL